MGHLGFSAWIWNHSSIQSQWNTCKQGNLRTNDFASNSSYHTQHVAAPTSTRSHRNIYFGQIWATSSLIDSFISSIYLDLSSYWPFGSPKGFILRYYGLLRFPHNIAPIQNNQTVTEAIQIATIAVSLSYAASDSEDPSSVVDHLIDMPDYVLGYVLVW